MALTGALEGVPAPKSLAAASQVPVHMHEADGLPAATERRPMTARPRRLSGPGQPQGLAQGRALAGVWRAYVAAAWPAARAAAEERNRQRKRPLAPRALCRQVRRPSACCAVRAALHSVQARWR